MLKNGLHIFKYKDSDIYYQGKYELDFLNNYYDKIDLKRGKSIKYMFNDKEYTYYPDFYLEKLNLIIEIKSSYYYKLHEQKNIKKKEATFDNNYNYILIMNKNYDELLKLLEKGK